MVYARMRTEAGVRVYGDLQKALEDPGSCEKACADSVSSLFFFFLTHFKSVSMPSY